MLVMRPVAPGHDRLGEIERAGRPRRVGKAGDDLVDAGVVERGLVGDDRAQRRDVDFGVGEPGRGDPDRRGIERRQIALDVDDRVMRRPGSRWRARRRCGRSRSASRDRSAPPARLPPRPRRRSPGRRRRRRPAQRGSDRAAPDMDDHRHPGDERQRFSRQPGRGHTRRDHDDRVLGGAVRVTVGCERGGERQHARFVQLPEA